MSQVEEFRQKAQEAEVKARTVFSVLAAEACFSLASYLREKLDQAEKSAPRPATASQ
jgi:hypothetical protein